LVRADAFRVRGNEMTFLREPAMHREIGRVVASLVSLGVLLALGTLPLPVALGQTREPLRIPLMESFSGKATEWGADLYTGSTVAQEMINQAGGVKGRPLEFYKADAPYDDLPTAVTMFRQLARDPNVPLVFDGGATTVIVAVHDLAEEFKVPLFAFTSGGRWRLPKFNRWVFRSLPTPESVLPVLVSKARAKYQIQKAALLWALDDEFSVANANVFRELANQYRIKLVEQSFRGKESDYSAQLTKIKAENVEAFLVTAQPFDAGLLVYQAREMGLNQPVIGDIALSATDYWKMSKGRVGETLLYSLYNPQDPRPFVQNFIKAYKARYAKEPSAIAARGGEGAFVLTQVLNRAEDLSREGIRKAFATARGVESMSGLIGWNGSGDATRQDVLLVMWKDGVTVPIPESFWK
jgi:branched-chain amino acid transport system substrate-binding protein